jgi:hypothetical protein
MTGAVKCQMFNPFPGSLDYSRIERGDWQWWWDVGLVAVVALMLVWP